jgi:hypothetical protein
MAALLLTTTAGLRMNEIPYRGGRARDPGLGRGPDRHGVRRRRHRPANGAGRAGARLRRDRPRRSPTAPEVPTWREIGVDAEMQLWQALFVPAATPSQVRAACTPPVARVQADPALQRRWAELGVDRAMALPPAESEAYIAAEVRAGSGIMAGRRPARRGAQPPAR